MVITGKPPSRQADAGSTARHRVVRPQGSVGNSAARPEATDADQGFTGGGSVCANPEEYFFWDGIHPAAAAHRFLGQQMLAAVVPEPSSQMLALMALSVVVGQRQARCRPS